MRIDSDCFDLLCWMSFLRLNPLTFRWIPRVRLDRQVCSMWHPPEPWGLSEAGWGMIQGKIQFVLGWLCVQLIRVIFVLELLVTSVRLLFI